MVSLIPRLLIGGEDLSAVVTSGVRITHGRSTPREQPDASTLTVTVPGRPPSAAWLGQPVTLDAVLDGVPYRRFTGRVSDAVGAWAWAGDTLVPSTALAATGPLAHLGRRVIGEHPWPAELDGARVARILTAATDTVAAVDHRFGSGFWDSWFGSEGTKCTLTANVTAAGRSPCWAVTMPAVPTGTDHPEWGVIVAGDGTVTPGAMVTVTGWARVAPGGDVVRFAGQFDEYAGEVVVPPDGLWHALVLPIYATNGGGVNVWCLPHDMAVPTAATLVHTTGLRATLDPHPFVADVAPGTVTVRARDVDARPALELAHEVAESAAGLLRSTTTGVVVYEDADSRPPEATPVLRLTAGDVLSDLSQELHVANLVNDVTVTYGPDTAGTQRPVHRLADPTSVVAWGRWGTTVSTILDDVYGAVSLANRIVGRNAQPTFTTPEVSLDLAWLAARGVDDAYPPGDAYPLDDTYPTVTDLELLTGLLSLDVSDVVDVELPEAAATSPWQWLEGWLEEVEHPGAWRLTLALSDFRRYGGAPAWEQGDPGTAWLDVGATVRWIDDTLDPLPA